MVCHILYGSEGLLTCRLVADDVLQELYSQLTNARVSTAQERSGADDIGGRCDFHVYAAIFIVQCCPNSISARGRRGARPPRYLRARRSVSNLTCVLGNSGRPPGDR